MAKIKVLTVVGARPQFIKAALLSRHIRRHFKEILVHTGQHYDKEMSGTFFSDLKIPQPDYNLGVVSEHQGKQTALMIDGLEKLILKEKPDLVIVFGDTNSTLAGALAAAKLNIPVAHIEAGMRSFRKDMSEETNRVVTDHLSTYLFCPTKTAVENLSREGLTKKVYLVGDIMRDAFKYYSKIAQKRTYILKRLQLKTKSYYLATVHRAENADSKERLNKIISILKNLDLPVILPLHPRTKKMLRKYNISTDSPVLKCIAPQGYLEMINLEKNSRAIITDSGGVQKEAFFLNVPCLTLRNETEWPETTKHGLNFLVDTNKDKLLYALNRINSNKSDKRVFGDGNAGVKIIKILRKFIQ